MFDLFEIDLLYDISAGCMRRCDDCVISAAAPMAKFGVDNVTNLLDQSKEYFMLGNCWLGPTDIFASNQLVSYDDPEVVEVASRFKSIILSTSLLGKDSEIKNHALRIAKAYPNIPIKLAIPVNMRDVDNKKYRTHIWDKINLFEQHLNRPLGTIGRKVYFIGNLPQNTDDVDPDIFLKFKDIWGVQLDVAIGNGRQGVEHLRPVFKQAINFFETRINLENNFPAALLKEGRGIDLLFRNGSLYFLPFYNERIVVLEEEFRLFKRSQWTVDNLVSEINNLMVKSLLAGEKLTECSKCEYNSRCSLFLLPLIQKKLNIDTCIQPKKMLKQYGTYNQTH
jgi:hypothetical protein